MKEIEKQMIAAINAGKSKRLGNTVVSVTLDKGVIQGVYVYLHDNMIAQCAGSAEYGAWKFSLAGWNTQMTRSRVSALCEAFGGPDRRGVYTKLGQAYVKRYAALVRDPNGKDTPIADSEWF